MGNIIDVEYREVIELEEMSTEELATEANSLWEQSEMVATISLNLLAQAGERLQIIKGRLPHGQWEEWCANNLKFSKSKAEKVMLFAAKAKDKTSIFAKTETFTDIGISKVYALLSTSEEVAKTMIENPESRDMSVREFKDEIKRLKEVAEDYRQKGSDAEDRIAELDTQLQEANDAVTKLTAQLKETTGKYDNEEELDRIKGELQKAEEKLDKEKAARKKDKEKAAATLEAAAAEAEERAKEIAEAKSKNQIELLEMQIADSKKEIEVLTKKLANNKQEDLAVFKVNATRLQEDFNACVASIAKVGEEDRQRAQQMKVALLQVFESMKERIDNAV